LRKSIIIFVALVILISEGLFRLPRECEAQNRIPPAEYHYYSLAITSILNSAAEASKLPDIPERVKLLLNAAKILPASQRDDAIRLLGITLRDLKEWSSDAKTSRYRRHAAATLRNEVLAIYARIDPEKTMTLQKEFQAEAESTANNTDATSLKTGTWHTEFSNQQTMADQSAKIALSLVDTDPEKALALVVRSLQGGIVSGEL
jgi:hypothetical protein